MFDLQFANNPRVFQANPSATKKRIFLLTGIAGVAAVAYAALTKHKTGNEPFFFAGGLTAVIFSLRFYLMQVMNPSRLTLSSDGITVGSKNSYRLVAWAELQSIRYRASKGGHYWEIKPRLGESLDFYLDGITSRQQEELREMIKSLQLPDVRVELYHDPLSKAA